MDGGLLGRIYSGSAYIKRYRTQEYFDSGVWRGTWEIDGGGRLMNQGIHLVVLLLWFCGDVSSTMALTSSMGRDVQVETQAQAILAFASGARGIIEATTLAYPELPQYIELYGSRGTAAFGADGLLRLDLIVLTPEEELAGEELRRISESAAMGSPRGGAEAGVAGAGRRRCGPGVWERRLSGTPISNTS